MLPARFSASPDPVDPGQALTICFDGSIEPAFLPGAVVTVGINNGHPVGSSLRMAGSVQITIGDDGKGCATWQVPSSGWGNAGLLQHESSVDGTFVVNDP